MFFPLFRKQLEVVQQQTSCSQPLLSRGASYTRSTLIVNLCMYVIVLAELCEYL